MAADNEEMRALSDPQTPVNNSGGATTLEKPSIKMPPPPKIKKMSRTILGNFSTRRALPCNLENIHNSRKKFFFYSPVKGDTNEAAMLILRLSEKKHTGDGYINSIGVPYKPAYLCFDRDSYETNEDILFPLQLHDVQFYIGKFRTITQSSKAEKQGVVICIDLSKELTECDIQNIEKYIQEIRQLSSPLPGGGKAEIILVGTNSEQLLEHTGSSSSAFFDTPNKLAAQRKQAEAMAKEKLISLAKDHNISEENVFVVSAKDGTGCDELLISLGRLSITSHIAAQNIAGQNAANDRNASVCCQQIRLGK